MACSFPIDWVALDALADVGCLKNDGELLLIVAKNGSMSKNIDNL